MAGLGAGGATGGGGPLAGLGALVGGNGILAIAAGLVVGVIGSGTLLATGAVHFGGGTAAPANLAAGPQLVACPGGPVIGTIPRGKKVLVTGRSADGRWLEIQYPGPAFDHAYTLAGPLRLESVWTNAGPLPLPADVSALPITACEAAPTPTPRHTPDASTAVGPTATPGATATPVATPTATPTAAPTPTPTPTAAPTPTPTPRPTPNAAPSITGLTASTKTLNFDQGTYCPTAPKNVTFTLKASDAGGIATATLYWRKPGASSYATMPMTLASGSAQKGTWRATLDTKANSITTAGRLTYYVVVRDSDGAQTRSPATGTQVITVNVCANTGPTFTQQPAADATTLSSDPTGKGCGQPLGTGITAAATDVDGVAGITLYFTGPGLGGTVSRPMSLNGTTWSSSINTGSDKIVGSGVITFYAIAVDKKGATTQSTSGSINVIACGSPASIQVVITSPPFQQRLKAYVVNDCSGTTPSIDFSITASDPDNGTQLLTVGFVWDMTNKSSGSVVSARSKVSSDGGTAYSASISSRTTSTWLTTAFFGANTLNYTVTTTDKNGGVTTFTGNATIYVGSCSPV